MRTLVKSGAGSALVHAAALGGLLLSKPTADRTMTIDLTIVLSESMESPPTGAGRAEPPSASTAVATQPRVRPRPAPSVKTIRAPAERPHPNDTMAIPAAAATAPSELPAPEPPSGPPKAGAISGTSQVEAPRGGEPGRKAGGNSQGIAGAGSDQGAGGAQQAYLAKHYAYIRDAIQRSASYPPLARRMGWVGRVVLAFHILPDGAVANVHVVNGSGFAVLDHSAVEAVRRASPFPPPPAAAEIVAPVAYALE
jgi:periplasmic protein TonB